MTSSAGCLTTVLCSRVLSVRACGTRHCKRLPVCGRSNPVVYQNILEVCKWEGSTHHIHSLGIDRVDRDDSLHGIVRRPRKIIQVEPDYVLLKRWQYHIPFDVLDPERPHQNKRIHRSNVDFVTCAESSPSSSLARTPGSRLSLDRLVQGEGLPRGS